MATKHQTLIEELYDVPDNGKAEIVNGGVKRMSPTGDLPSRAGLAITISLRIYERQPENSAGGRVYPDNAGFVVALPDRQSFSPDAAFYVGPRTGGRFLQGAPIFAVEVRSEGDYGARAEREIAAKRHDYFTAGTLVVWDVDVLREQLVRVYRATAPDEPVVYRRGEQAEAGPAVPGWTMPVDELFT